MDRSAVVKVGAVASATVCALFGGVVLAQYMLSKKQRAGKKTKIIEMVSLYLYTICVMAFTARERAARNTRLTQAGS